MANGNIVIENARLIFKNFRGVEQKFNAAGNRNFCVVLDDRDAKNLERDGWNVKYLSPRDPDDDPLAYIQVSVNFEKGRPPKIIQITGSGEDMRKTQLDADSVGNLDWADIETVDLTISPYHYEVGGRTGIKGYLNSMYVTLVEDELESKYYNIQER